MAGEAENEETEVKGKKPPSTTKIVFLAVALASIISGGAVGLTLFFLADDLKQSAASAKGNDAGTGDDGDHGQQDAHSADVSSLAV